MGGRESPLLARITVSSDWPGGQFVLLGEQAGAVACAGAACPPQPGQATAAGARRATTSSQSGSTTFSARPAISTTPSPVEKLSSVVRW